MTEYEGLPFEFYEALMPALTDDMTNEDKQALIHRVLADWDKSKDARFPPGVAVTRELAELRLVAFTRRWALAQAATDGETQHG